MEIPKQLVLDVTAEDIREGVPGDCDRCPLARAARRQFPGFHIGTDFCGLAGRWWRNAPDTQSFIQRFDRGFVVKPGQYVMTED